MEVDHGPDCTCGMCGYWIKDKFYKHGEGPNDWVSAATKLNPVAIPPDVSKTETTITKDNGDNFKKDSGKLKYSLVPIYPMEEVVRAYTIGAMKYSENAWRDQAGEWSRIISACHRHLEAWKKGEKFDTKDGQHHLAAVAWCAFTLMEFEKFKLGKDDRAFKEFNNVN